LKLTVLHTETLKRWGGQQNRVLAEAAGLNRRGHSVMIACHKGSVLSEKAKKAGIRVFEMNMVKQAHLKTIPRLVSVIKKEGVDLVTTHSSVDSWAGGIAARLAGKRLVRFRHNLYPVGKDPLTKFIYAIPDKIIAISETVKKALVGRGIKDGKITVIPSSVDPDVFNPETDDLRKELNLSPDAVIIGNTSTFTMVKGQEYLLRAFNIIGKQTSCYLLFAGNLPEEKKYKYLKHVDEALRDRVILLGHREDVPRVLKTLDLFVYPSLREGLGTALLEAMMMGKAVLVSDIPTFRHFIEDKINGLYFRAEDCQALAEKTISLLQDDHLKDSLGKNARGTAIKKFNTESMIDSTEACYEEVMGSS
jgi:glycosyltransferase involved in cell wall biosynthesis